MQDHLKAAAAAAVMSDEEIAVAMSVLHTDGILTPFEQAILDEAVVRKIESAAGPLGYGVGSSVSVALNVQHFTGPSKRVV